MIKLMLNKDDFTAKEIEVFMFLHEFRRHCQSGEITVTFHNSDFDKFRNIKYEAKLTGQTGTAGIDFANRLMEILSLMKNN